MAKAMMKIEVCDEPDTCERCERWVLHGQQMVVTKTGVEHLTKADCDSALPDLVLTNERVRGPERWPRLEVVGTLLEDHPFRFARTMPKVPHCYTLKKQWDAATFNKVVLEIKRLGEARRWWRQWYDYLDVNEYYYWFTEDREAPPEATTLINRALRADYDLPEPTWWPDGVPGIVAELLKTYVEDDARAYFRRLDIGCAFSEADCFSYMGIGPAGDIERVVRTKAKRALATNVSFFVPPTVLGTTCERYDLIVCGAASRLQRDELDRLPLLLAPNGKIVLVFHGDRAPRQGSGVWRAGLWMYPGVAYTHGEWVVMVSEPHAGVR